MVASINATLVYSLYSRMFTMMLNFSPRCRVSTYDIFLISVSSVLIILVESEMYLLLLIICNKNKIKHDYFIT